MGVLEDILAMFILHISSSPLVAVVLSFVSLWGNCACQTAGRQEFTLYRCLENIVCFLQSNSWTLIQFSSPTRQGILQKTPKSCKSKDLKKKAQRDVFVADWINICIVCWHFSSEEFRMPTGRGRLVLLISCCFKKSVGYIKQPFDFEDNGCSRAWTWVLT